MKSEYPEIIDSLHKLADWIEKENHLQCHSVPRKAAYLIGALEEDNRLMRLQLNKRKTHLIDYVNMAIGLFRLFIYKLKKRLTK
jgi:hypothetical protein